MAVCILLTPRHLLFQSSAFEIITLVLLITLKYISEMESDFIKYHLQFSLKWMYKFTQLSIICWKILLNPFVVWFILPLRSRTQKILVCEFWWVSIFFFFRSKTQIKINVTVWLVYILASSTHFHWFSIAAPFHLT